MTSFIEKRKNGKGIIFSILGGVPSMEATKDCVKECERLSVDALEIGIPFSDPIGEGSVREAAHNQALKENVTMDGVLDLLASLAPLTIPIVLRVYSNSIFHYSYEAFFARAEQVGVKGILVLDMPIEELGEIRPYAAAHHIAVLTLLATTDPERIVQVMKDNEGYLPVCGLEEDALRVVEENREGLYLIGQGELGEEGQLQVPSFSYDGISVEVTSYTEKEVAEKGDHFLSSLMEQVKK